MQEGHKARWAHLLVAIPPPPQTSLHRQAPSPPLRPPPGASGYGNGNDHGYGSGHIKGGSGYHNVDRNSNGNGHVYTSTGRYWVQNVTTFYQETVVVTNVCYGSEDIKVCLIFIICIAPSLKTICLAPFFLFKFVIGIILRSHSCFFIIVFSPYCHWYLFSFFFVRCVFLKSPPCLYAMKVFCF